MHGRPRPEELRAPGALQHQAGHSQALGHLSSEERVQPEAVKRLGRASFPDVQHSSRAGWKGPLRLLRP